MSIIISIMQELDDRNCNISESVFTELFSIIKLFFIIKFKKSNSQDVLMLLSFLTFGIGDGVTSAYMMQVRGIRMEFNPLIRNVFMYHGFTAAVLIKCVFVLFILFTLYIIYLTTDTYWSINGFLIALSISGILAINSNINAINGCPYPSPYKIIFIFFGLVILFVEMGNFIDNI